MLSLHALNLNINLNFKLNIKKPLPESLYLTDMIFMLQKHSTLRENITISVKSKFIKLIIRTIYKKMEADTHEEDKISVSMKQSEPQSEQNHQF